MLFLAVFCGFMAENFREHQIEHKREKEYITSLIKDVELDQHHFSYHPMSGKNILLILIPLCFC